MQRRFNFNAGPAAMPLPVLQRLQNDLVDYQGKGLSVLEMSHRSSDFMEIAAKAEADLRLLLQVPDNYAVLFMQGGASSQFALTVSNLDSKGQVAFANTGYWSQKAIDVAKASTEIIQVATASKSVPCRVPPVSEWLSADNASYLHITDNETIDGVRLHDLPQTPLPIVADMSSCILSQPIDVSRYALIYAGAQKNIGPAGITLVIVREDMLERSESRAHVTQASVFNYAAMHKADSMLNTPPTFAWYAAGLVFQWLLDEGGLSAIAARNERQAQAVYSAIDDSEAYVNAVHPQNRSLMNIPFKLTQSDQQDSFLAGAADRGLIGLKGHKSVGGLRASLYNAVTDPAVAALVDYLGEFSGAGTHTANARIHSSGKDPGAESTSASIQESPVSVAYLGPEGTYTHAAADRFFGSAATVHPEPGIAEIFGAVETHRAEFGVVPVENSTEGAVNQTLDLLTKTSIRVSGEIRMRIQHCLLGHAAQMTAIKEVRAHPQALAQCKNWLRENLPGVALINESSNAAAARLAVERADIAAIASETAAELYDLPVMNKGIEDIRNNTTRFLVIGHRDSAPTGDDSSLLLVSAPHKPGGLRSILGPLEEAGVSMTRIESRPSGSALWEYVFFINVDGHQQDEKLSGVLEQLRELAPLVKVLGSYPRAV